MNRLFTRALVCGLAASLLSIPAIAQETQGARAADEEPIEEIIAVGVRRSLELALQNKRNADSIMDGIAAEGIGKFPDLNLADSLSRVTGVQIDTSGPSGERREGQIAVRGLPNRFSKTMVNGQTLASPNFNGGFAFGIFESDVVSAINVVKSPTARHDEGGLSGIVDIRTLRPLRIRENFLTASTELDYEGLSEDVVPNIGLAWGHKFRNDSLGVFANIKWSDQSFRTDSARLNAYNDDDTNDDGLADLFTPREARYNSRSSEGDRLSFAGGIEFQANDNLKFGALGIYSSYALINELDQLRVQARNGGIEASNLVPGGVFGDTYTQAVFLDPEIDVEARVFDDEFDTYGNTADVEWSNDDWTARGVIHHSSAGYDRFAIQSRRNIDDNEGHEFAVAVNTGAGNVNGFSISATGGDDWSNPAFYTYGDSPTSDDPAAQEWRQRFLASRGTERREKEQAVQFDLARHFDTAFFTSLEGGLKYRVFERDQLRPSWSVSGWDFSGVDDLGVMQPSLSSRGSGFFGGNLGGIEYLVPQWEAVYNGLLANNTCEGECIRGLPYTNDNVRTFNTEVDIASVYLLVTFDGSNLGTGIPLRGNLGVRHVETDRDVRAYTESDLLVGGEQQTSAKFDFSDTLPSVNVIWDITEDLMLRGAYYETIVRPNANSYTVASSVDVNPDDWDDPDVGVDNVQIDLGNPYLLPFSADAFDLSLEWYNREGSGISLAYFKKDIVNGIEDRVLCPSSLSELSQLDVYDFTGIITGQLSESGGQCLDEAGVEVVIEDRVNNSEGFTIDGWEIGVLQNFDFLDNWMSGFGFRFNYTSIDTSEGPDFDSSGNRLPLENVSETTYNIIGFYEMEDWGVRLAYRNRSEYFLESDGSFTGEDRFVGETERLDLSASWRPIEQLSVRAEIFNLTDETRIEYQGLRARVRDLRYTGRTYTLGLKYRF